MNIDWNIITAVGGMVSALAAVVGTMVTIFALRADHRRSRLTLQTELGLRLEESTETEEMRALRKVAATKLLEGKSPNPELTRLLDNFSRIAWLIERGVLDLELIFLMQEYWITRYWLCAATHVQSIRTSRKDALIWGTLERLVEQLMIYRSDKGLPPLTDEQLREFLQAESQGW